MAFFTAVYHHAGAFVYGPPLRYEGGKITAVHGLDRDRWGYYEALRVLKDLGYFEEGDMWWLPNGGSMDMDLIYIQNDKDALAVANYALINSVEVDIYIKHRVSRPNVIDLADDMDDEDDEDDKEDEEDEDDDDAL